MLRVTVSGVTSCENRGVQALVRSVAQGLRQLRPCRITVLTQTPEQDRRLSDDDIEWVADPFVVAKSWRGARSVETVATAAERADALLAATDLLVTTGGDLHTGDYGVSTRYLAAPIAAIGRSIPVAMLAHSIGPFTDPGEARDFARAATRSAVVTVREQISLRYARNSLAIPANTTVLTADPAFLLAAATPERIDEILASSGIGLSRPYVCLAPSNGIAGFRGLDRAGHVGALLRLVAEVRARWRVPVLLIPHVHDSRPANDDRILAAELIRLAGAGDMRALPDGLTAGEYKGVVARSELLVAQRLHAAIGGLSSGVPTLAIGYSHKFDGVLADSYGCGVPLADVHLNIETFVGDSGAGANLLRSVDPDRLRRFLDARLPVVRQRARDNFVLAWRALAGAAP